MIPAFMPHSGQAASVRSLFVAGEQGAWYDPSDRATLFQDAAGTTPVTAVEQPVGLMLDKSGRGNHAYQSTSAARPVLSARINQYLATETLATQNVTTLATNYTLTFTGTGTITLSGTKTGAYSAGTHTITCTSGTLTSTVAGAVTKADLRVSNDGVGLPAYQRVNTATDYDTAGFPLYIKPNGSSQFMVTNSIDFTATDKMTVCVGARTVVLSPVGLILELSAAVQSNVGTFYLSTRDTNTKESACIHGTGPAATVGGMGVPAPAYTYIHAAALDITKSIASEQIIGRINGAPYVIGDASPTSSTTGFGNYPLYLFARGGTAHLFGGRFYGAVIRGAQSNAAQIEAAERYMNQKTRAY